MRPKNIVDALGGIDADMIADAERKIRTRNPWLKRAVIAACLCLAICAAVCAPMFLGELPDEMTDGSTGGNGSDVVIGTYEDRRDPDQLLYGGLFTGGYASAYCFDARGRVSEHI